MKIFVALLAFMLSFTLISSAMCSLPASAAGNFVIQEQETEAVDEGSGYYSEYSEDARFIFDILFWLILSVPMFIVPLGLFILGIVMPLIKKYRKEKYWFLLSGVSALWFVCSVVIVLILIIGAIIG